MRFGGVSDEVSGSTMRQWCVILAAAVAFGGGGAAQGADMATKAAKAPPAPAQVAAARTAPPAAPKHGPSPAAAAQRPHPRGTFLDILV